MGMGLTDEDVVSHTDVSIGPRAPVVGENLLERALIRHRLVVLAPLGVALHRLELLLHLA